MDNTQLILNQAISGAFTSYIIEFLKNSKLFPFLKTTSSEDVKRYFALAFAVATSVGLNYQFEPTTRMLTIHIPLLNEAFHSVWDIAKVYMFQQLTYKLNKEKAA
jgi:hypothetical protein